MNTEEGKLILILNEEYHSFARVMLWKLQDGYFCFFSFFKVVYFLECLNKNLKLRISKP